MASVMVSASIDFPHFNDHFVTSTFENGYCGNIMHPKMFTKIWQDGGGRVSMGRLLMSTVAVLTVACLARIAEGGKLIKIIFTLILFAM